MTENRDDFLSGSGGLVFGKRATFKAVLSDAYSDALALAMWQPRRLRHAARSCPRRRVMVLGIERDDGPNLLAQSRRELMRSRHEVSFATTDAGERGKFENLNALLSLHPPHGYDWLLAVDDDVSLPRGFLDRFLFLAEHFGLALAQPAHRRRSHAAWEVTRRRPASVVRETAFVEIGPVLALHRMTFEVLLPFPALRVGWGLDAHWSAVAKQRGWKLGVIDATPIRHGARRIAACYDRGDAVEEARRFLADRPYTAVTEAQRTLAIHRRWR